MADHRRDARKPSRRRAAGLRARASRGLRAEHHRRLHLARRRPSRCSSSWRRRSRRGDHELPLGRLAPRVLWCGASGRGSHRRAGLGRAREIPRPRRARPTAPSSFATTCQVCHGQAGIGGVGPRCVARSSPRRLRAQVLQEGRPGTMMPQFTATMSRRRDRWDCPLRRPQAARRACRLAGLRGDANAGAGGVLHEGLGAQLLGVPLGRRPRRPVGPDLMSDRRAVGQADLPEDHRRAAPLGRPRLQHGPPHHAKTGAILTGIRSGETKGRQVPFLRHSRRCRPSCAPFSKSRHRRLGAASRARVMPNDYAARLTLAAAPRRRRVPQVAAERRTAPSVTPRRRRGVAEPVVQGSVTARRRAVP